MGLPLWLTSELGNELCPNRDHPDKQRNRRQSRRFFHKHPQHRSTPAARTYEEHCSFFVLGVKRRPRVSLKKGPERNRLVNLRKMDREPGGLNAQSRRVWGSWLASPLYRPNDSDDAQNQYRDAYSQSDHPGRLKHDLVVGDVQRHGSNMRRESARFQPVRRPVKLTHYPSMGIGIRSVPGGVTESLSIKGRRQTEQEKHRPPGRRLSHPLPAIHKRSTIRQ